MEVFRHLEKSNCRQCGEKTCLAFAASVYQSRKQINMCSRLDADIISRLSDVGNSTENIGEMGEQLIEDLKEELRKTDLSIAAQRCGGDFDGAKLTLKILGKKFGVDSVGNFSSDIHVNPWIVTSFLDYVVGGKGKDPVGDWISFRELIIRKEFSYPFFQKRCEQVMKNIADRYIDWFDDLVHLFGGQRVAEQFESDVSVVIFPLPKVPIMICYWGEEDGMESTLNLLFDKSVDENLPKGSLFTLCVGLALMFEKLSQRHAIA
jgi:hypothetical protein